MSVKSVGFLGNLNAGGDTNRRPSPVIWQSCPKRDEIERAGGTWFFDDFNPAGNATMTSAFKGSLGQWSIYGDAGALVQNGQDNAGTISPLEGGWITIGSNDDNEGVTLFSSAGAFQFMTTTSATAPGYRNRIYYECRCSRGTVAATKNDCFIGLCDPILSAGVASAAQPISTTINTLDTTNGLFGFFSAGSSAGSFAGPTDFGVAFLKAGSTVNAPTNLTGLLGATSQTVLAAASIVKLGFIYDPNAYQQAVSGSPTARQTAGAVRRKLIRFFVNGIETPTFLSNDDMANATAAQAFPIGFMCPTIATMNDAGSTPGTFSVDWIKCVSLPNS